MPTLTNNKQPPNTFHIHKNVLGVDIYFSPYLFKNLPFINIMDDREVVDLSTETDKIKISKRDYIHKHINKVNLKNKTVGVNDVGWLNIGRIPAWFMDAPLLSISICIYDLEGNFFTAKDGAVITPNNEVLQFFNEVAEALKQEILEITQNNSKLLDFYGIVGNGHG